jgi:hypothetical protein
MSCGCKGKNANANGGGNAGANICVKCLSFWILVALLAFGILLHKHEADGTVYF